MAKKVINFLILCSIFLVLLSGCSKQNKNAEKKISVVAAIFPEYDWAKVLAEKSDKIQVELLVKNGTDLHSFQPSAAEIIKISTADLFIYTGGESDQWVEEVLKNSNKTDLKVISLMDLLKENAKVEEIVEGMQAEEEHDEESEEEIEYDEHLWLSIKNAKRVSAKISETYQELDSSNSELYKENLLAYLEKLSALEEKQQQVSKSLKNSGRSVMIFADRFPFRYFTDEAELTYFAAFSGCSAETEASFETIANLAQKVKDYKVPAIFVTESSDNKLAQTVISASGIPCKILLLDSMQSVSFRQSQNGASYLSIMTENLNNLSKYATMVME